MISYLIHTSILLAGSYIFYWLLLRRETFFRLNRWTLMSCIALSLALPVITIPASWSLMPDVPETIYPVSEENTQGVVLDKFELDKNTFLAEKEQPVLSEEQPVLPIAPKVRQTNSLSWNNALSYVYYLGAGIFLITFLVQLVLLIAKMFALNSIKDGKHRIVELVKDEAPYSFWNAIFINPTKYDYETYEQILEHEKIHINQFHFFDKLLSEALVILFWFNPIAWMYRRAVTNNLEYLTDQSMLEQGTERQLYQMSLLRVSVPQYPLNLTTNYNQSFLKNRIAMMNSKKSSLRSIWKYLFVLPLFVFSLLTLNNVYSEPTENKEHPFLTFENKINKDFPTVLKPKTLEASPEAKKDFDIAINNMKEKHILKELEMMHQIRQKMIAALDTFPYPKQMPKVPEFPMKKEEVVKKLKEDPTFVEEYESMVEEYVGEVEEWQKELYEENTEMARDFHNVPETAPAPKINLPEGFENFDEMNDAEISKEMAEHAKELSKLAEKMAGKEILKFKKENPDFPFLSELSKVEFPPSGDDFASLPKSPGFPSNAASPFLAENSDMRRSSLAELNDMKNFVIHSSTFLDPATPNGAHWKWPDFQKLLIENLLSDKIINNANSINMIITQNNLFVNGNRHSPEIHSKYLTLLYQNDFNNFHNIDFKKIGNNITVISGISGLNELQRKLNKILVEEKVIKNKRQDVILKMTGEHFMINKEKLPASVTTKLHEALAEHGLIPAPGKVIKLNFRKADLGAGYERGNAFYGTWLKM